MRNDLAKLLAGLRNDGARLWVHEGRLRYTAPVPLRPDVLQTLREYRAEVVELLRRDRPARETPLAGWPRPDPLPLSLGQGGLWFIHQLDNRSAAYNVTTALRVDGPFDATAFRLAVAEVLRRHESLRTVFPAVAGTGVQVIAGPPSPNSGVTDLVDLTALPAAERATVVSGIVAQEQERVFDLATGPLFRVCLVRLADREHVVVVNAHHLVIDNTSTGILFEELGALYTAYVRGQDSPLPPPTAQYADHTLWQRAWLRGEVLDAQLGYWRSRLAGAPPALNLPTDHPRPAAGSLAGATAEFTIPADVVTMLGELAATRSTSVPTVLLAGLHALLSRWARQDDVSIGMPVDARGHRDAERVVGYFVNTIVSRALLPDGITLAGLVDQVRDGLAADYEHRDVPFDHVVADLSPTRSLGRHPLFQVMFAFIGSAPLRLGDLRVTPVPVPEATAKFDLTLWVAQPEPGRPTRAGFEYARDLFRPETVRRLAAGYVTLLAAAVRRPDHPLAALPLLPPDELAELTPTASAPDDDRCLHELFEGQVVRGRGVVAVRCGGREVSYGELDGLANGLAVVLRGLGVGPDVVVGVCVGRSVELVVALLGVLKAGGGYVPLDPSYPVGRLRGMVSDCGASVVVSAGGVGGWLAGSGVVVVDVSSVGGSSSAVGAASGVVASNVAYCLYTSGSTGRPKAVVLEHRNAVAFVRWALDRFDPADLARTLFGTSVGFDLSVIELFAPLAVGATVVVVPDVLALTAAPAPEPTLVDTVPSAARVLADADAIPPSVRMISLAGEPLRSDLVHALRRAAPQARIVNLYGPTEYAPGCSGEVTDPDRVTIGEPGRTQLLILDERLHPVPRGVVGEVHLAGAALARGYLGQPALTAERFLPNPFGPPGGRMYRTGDLARYLPTGEVEFHGRADHQVKIRGFRVEPGEIEAALLARPEVSDAVVTARADAAGAHPVAYLVAYLVADPDAEPAIRTALAARLPAFMLPAAYVYLDRLPLNRNGKVDRAALPEPTGPHRDGGTAYVAPRTPLERQLVELWQEVLGVPRIGVHDDFFALGGTSLLVVAVVSRMGDLLGLEPRPQLLFEYSTVAEVADYAQSRSTGAI